MLTTQDMRIFDTYVSTAHVSQQPLNRLKDLLVSLKYISVGSIETAMILMKDRNDLQIEKRDLSRLRDMLMSLKEVDV